jgi:hypothetical protein
VYHTFFFYQPAAKRCGTDIIMTPKQKFSGAYDGEVSKEQIAAGDAAVAALNSSEAAAIRMNNVLASINTTARSSVSTFATDLVDGLVKGETTMQALEESASALGNTTITQSTMASHTHTGLIHADIVGNVASIGTSGQMYGNPPNTGSTGGDGAHNHTINFSVAYVDLIICQKD